MNVWELRQAIESAIPLWVYGAIVVFALSVAVYGIVTRGRRR